MLSKVQFSIGDYVICGLTLCISLAIGLYYACSSGRRGNVTEYHLGNRNLNFLPVMLSLMVTTQSSIFMLGVPAEAYLYGYLSTLTGIALGLSYWISARVMIPLVYPLKLTSVNEYFELRYKNNRVRILTTVLNMIFWVIYLGIVTYGVSTAIENLLGAPVWMSVLIVSTASMIYTAIGGIKAVVWTDVLQFLVMLTSLLAIIIQGSSKVGGGSEVLRINSNGGRLNIWNFSLDPTIKYTIPNLLIGGVFKVLAFAFSQASVQRSGCMSSIKEAYKMFYIAGPLSTLSVFMSGSMGLVAYAYFDTVRCDPLAGKFIRNPNQIVPTLVSEIFQETPGMKGLFIAGLLSASLSTISSGYAALSSMTLQDIIRKKWTTISDRNAMLVSKLTVVVVSWITTGMALLLANVKGTLLKRTPFPDQDNGLTAGVTGRQRMFTHPKHLIPPLVYLGIQLVQLVMTIPTAPFSGLILYSVFCTSATTAGAIAGGIVSSAFYLWMSIGKILVSNMGVEEKLNPASVDNCFGNFSPAIGSSESNLSRYDGFHNDTQRSFNTQPTTLEGFNKIYSLSYQWFDLIAVLLVIVVGLIVSKIVGAPKEEDVDVRYVLSFTEQLFPYLPEKVKYFLSCRSTISKRRKQLQTEDSRNKQYRQIDIKDHNDSFRERPPDSREQNTRL